MREDVITSSHAVALWCKEELNKLAPNALMFNVLGYDIWITQSAFGHGVAIVELRCTPYDFRLLRVENVQRSLIAIYDYADPDSFDQCLADMREHLD